MSRVVYVLDTVMSRISDLAAAAALRTVDLFIFGGLVGILTLVVGASRAMEQGCLTGCGLIILLLAPVALALFVIGAIRYRVWRDRLFLSIFVGLVLAVAILMKVNFTSAEIAPVLGFSALLSLIPSLLLWQVIMALALGVHVLRSRTRPGTPLS